METLHTQCAGGIVMNQKGEVALVMSGPRHENFWGFPKGHIDEGEDALVAARREVSEEIGIDELVLIQVLPPYKRYKGNKDGGDDTSELKTIHMFLFGTTQEHLSPRDEWNPEAIWCPLEKVVPHLTHPKDRKFFEGVAPVLKH